MKKRASVIVLLVVFPLYLLVLYPGVQIPFAQIILHLGFFYQIMFIAYKFILIVPLTMLPLSFRSR